MDLIEVDRSTSRRVCVCVCKLDGISRKDFIAIFKNKYYFKIYHYIVISIYIRG